MNGGGRGLCKGIVFLTKRYIFALLLELWKRGWGMSMRPTARGKHGSS